jgi:hypothetical protein
MKPLSRTLELLLKLQDQRRTRERHQLDAAASLLQMHKEDGLPYNPAEDGFVFSNEDIEMDIHRNQRLDDAIERAAT